MPPILSSNLTQNQKEAVIHSSGPLIVIAGPGAGEPRFIIEKCVYLIKETGKKPENILVTTFTNKVTDELYDRLCGADWTKKHKPIWLFSIYI
jgi:DNA helicase II / ATP-dependent DNA helicase PcrA